MIEGTKLLSKEDDLERMRYLMHERGIYQKSQLVTNGIRPCTLKSHYRTERSKYLCPPIRLDQRPEIIGISHKGRLKFKEIPKDANRRSYEKLDAAIQKRESQIPLKATVTICGHEVVRLELTGEAKRIAIASRKTTESPG